MKAGVVESPGEIIAKEVPEPVLEQYDCLCEGLYCSTCSGTDLHLLMGEPMPFDYTFPTIIGHEAIGRIIETGPGVRNFKVGDIVTRLFNRPAAGIEINWGGFAERGLITDYAAQKEAGALEEPGESGGPKILPEISYTAHRILPSDFDPAASTIIITLRETLSFISRIGAPAGGRVLIAGSGGNGLAFANHAVNMQASKVVMIGGSSRREDALKVGVTDYLQYDRDNLIDAAHQQGLDEFDLIIDAVGKVGLLNKLLELLKAGGVVTTYGVDDFGKISIEPECARGTFTYANYSYHDGEAHEQTIELVKKKLLRPEDYCDLNQIFELDEIADAFEAIRNRQMVKAVVKLSL